MNCYIHVYTSSQEVQGCLWDKSPIGPEEIHYVRYMYFSCFTISCKYPWKCIDSRFPGLVIWNEKWDYSYEQLAAFVVCEKVSRWLLDTGKVEICRTFAVRVSQKSLAPWNEKQPSHTEELASLLPCETVCADSNDIRYNIFFSWFTQKWKPFWQQKFPDLWYNQSNHFLA